MIVIISINCGKFMEIGIIVEVGNKAHFELYLKRNGDYRKE